MVCPTTPKYKLFGDEHPFCVTPHLKGVKRDQIMVRLKNVCDASIQNGGLKCVGISMAAKAMFFYYKKFVVHFVTVKLESLNTNNYISLYSIHC